MAKHPSATNNSDQVVSFFQYKRETVESIIVAFILAFLFRAFVAEAFVIPTGSMAPTLMGAHKDILCNECGVRYQVGASSEFNNANNTRNGTAVVGSTGALSRAVNAIDFSDPNQATFSGDRILVSKFDYILSKPARWDVLVFKFPGEARMNYIKRLIGLPNEQLMIQEGDIYVRKNDTQPWQIARKPVHKALAMRQPVSDTNHQAVSLLDLGFPSLWQPWADDEQQAQGTVQQNRDSWQATLPSSDQTQWLRYFHKDLTRNDWLNVVQDKQLPEVGPYDSTLVTDYLAYNSYMTSIAPRQMTVEQLVSEIAPSENGMHWVSDLTAEYEIDIQSDSGTLLLQVVEHGIRFLLSINISDGQAKLEAFDGLSSESESLKDILSGEADLVAATPIRGKGNYRVAMGNVDEQIFVWVNGKHIKFNRPAEFDSWKVRSEQQRRPYATAKDPLDAAPLGIGTRGAAMLVSRAQVYRDLYYIAIRSGLPHEFGGNLSLIRSEAPRGSNLAMLSDSQLLRYTYSNPELWSKTPLFSLRQKQLFELGEDQYFPMGDNSAQSSDARMWNQNYVEGKFLLGKALLVFWPHPWNRPIPFLPNVRRMGLIR